MATEKQKKALDAMVENGGIVSKAMIKAGYSKGTAKTPQKLTESDGFKELCEQYGLTDELLLKSLVSDIKEKVGNRKGEMELGFKIKGRMVERQDITSGGEKLTIAISKEIADKNETDPSTSNNSK
jgi:hypothetical protein